MITKFTPAERVQELEQMNQVQFEVIKQLTEKIERLELQTRHLENLLLACGLEISLDK